MSNDTIEIMVYNHGRKHQVWTTQFEVSVNETIIGIFDVVKVDAKRSTTNSIDEPSIGDIGYTDGVGWTKIVNKRNYE